MLLVITTKPTMAMIRATNRLCTSVPMMIATATVTTISAPTTNWTSLGTPGPVLVTAVRLAAHLRAVAPTGAAAGRLIRLRGGAAVAVIGPPAVGVASPGSGSGSGSRVSPAAMSTTSGMGGASPASGSGPGAGSGPAAGEG